MIWIRGAIVPNEELKIPLDDRIFEHGLGLFETLRTYDGRPALLDRHLERLRRSARALGLAIEDHALPSPEDVERLRRAEGLEDDCVLRIALTGGRDEHTPGALWMKARPLPDPPAGDLRIRATWTLASDDHLASHKTLNYWRKRLIHEQAVRAGFDEDLGRDPSGALLEGTRSNMFILRNEALLTPALERPGDPVPRPLLPGVMRGAVIERARTLGLAVEETAGLTIEDLARSDECFLTNGGWGIRPVARFEPAGPRPTPALDRRFEAPGALTQRLADALDRFLRTGA